MRLFGNLHGVSHIEKPCIGEGQTAWEANDWPESYIRYQAAFEENLKIDDANVQQVADAPDPDDPDDTALAESKSFLDRLAHLAEDEPIEESVMKEPLPSADGSASQPRNSSSDQASAE